MNSVLTFPSIIENAGLPKRFFGSSITPQYNNYVAHTPFHKLQMEEARKRVEDVARINKKNNLNYSIGGTRNLLEKPQPQGSFAMPLSMSGNNTYHTANKMEGSGGAFRTRAGQQYGINLLEKRAKQLQELELSKEEGMPISTMERPSQPVPLTQESEAKISFDLILDEINILALDGQYDKINNADVRKAYGTLRKIILDLDLETLKDYYEFINDLIDDIENTELKRTNVDEILRKMSALIQVAIASFYKSPSERKTFVNQFAKVITRLRANFQPKINQALRSIDNMEDAGEIMLPEEREVQITTRNKTPISMRTGREGRMATRTAGKDRILFKKMKVKDLRDLAREEGIDVAGLKKNAIIETLIEADVKPRVNITIIDDDSVGEAPVGEQIPQQGQAGERETKEEEDIQEGSGAWNTGMSRMNHLFGRGGLAVDEDGQAMLFTGLNDDRFSTKRNATQSGVIAGNKFYTF